MQVARDLGAVVVEGPWPGDFAAARNAALGHCRGTWVLSLDADEEVRCPDPGAARSLLRAVPPTHRALQVSIDNATGLGLGAGYATLSDRLFRPDRCRWRGRLHEQLVDPATGELVSSAHVSFLRIAHHGYLAGTLATRHKAERNLALARAEVADPSFGDKGLALVLLGRALWAAGRAEEALGPLLDGASATRNPTSRRQALAAAARILLGFGRTSEARTVVARLRAASRTCVLPDILDAGVHLLQDEPAQALTLLGKLTTVARDDDGYEHSPTTVAPWTAEALLALDRPGEAVDLLLGLLRETRVLDAELDFVVEALERAGRDLSELACAVPPELAERVVAAALGLEPGRAGAVLVALWRHEQQRLGQDSLEQDSLEQEQALDPRALTVLAGAALLGRVLPAPQATQWSKELRAHGLGELCPLVALAADETAPRSRRLTAARAACQLGDRRAHETAARLSTDPAPHVTPAPTGGPPPEVSVVVVARRGAAALLTCLEALARTLAGEGDTVEAEVVVVDPGSRDGSAQVLDSLAGDVALVRFDDDPGTARARNAGAVVSRGKVLVFLDAAAAPAAGWLTPLLARLRTHPRCGAVSACLLGPDHTVATSVATLRLSSCDARPAHGLARRSWTVHGAPRIALDWAVPGDNLAETAVPTAHALAVRRQAFDAVGGFDGGYVELAEDLELVMALRALGDEVAVEPQSHVVLDVALDDAADPRTLPFGTTEEPDRPFAETVGRRWSAGDNHALFAERWAASVPADGGGGGGGGGGSSAQADRSR